VEAAFPRLEGDLESALRFSKNPVFYRELGRLYLKMAVADMKFREGEKMGCKIAQGELFYLGKHGLPDHIALSSTGCTLPFIGSLKVAYFVSSSHFFF
jgi:hypothetical protein